MGDIVYDTTYSLVLLSMVKPNKQARPPSRAIKRIQSRIYQDLVTYDKIVIPEHLLPLFQQNDNRLEQVLDSYHFVGPKILEQSNLTPEDRRILEHAAILKPFLIEGICCQALQRYRRRRENTYRKIGLSEQDSLFIGLDPLYEFLAIHCDSISVESIERLISEMYDFALTMFLIDSNSALECISDSSLRFGLVEWLNRDTNKLDAPGFQFFDSSVYYGHGPSEFIKDILKLCLNECNIIDYAARFSTPCRCNIVKTKNIYLNEKPLNTFYDLKAMDDAFSLVKLQMAQHIKVRSVADSMTDALAARDHKSWKIFRENMGRYQSLLKGGISDSAVARSIIKDIKLAQKNLKNAEKLSRRAANVAYSSLAIATLEFFLSLPPVLGIGASIVACVLGSKSAQLSRSHGWILLGVESSNINEN